MESKSFRRIVHGIGAHLYNQGVTVLVQTVGVPIRLLAWGPQLYGEWLVLFALPVYLTVLDLGLSHSAANDMTAKVSRGDKTRALCVFQTLAGLVLLVIALGLTATLTLLWLLPFPEWLRFDFMSADVARLALMFLAAEVFIRLFDGVTHAGFRASGEYALHLGLISTARLLQFSAMWGVALAGGGPLEAATAFLGVRIAATFSLSVFLAIRHRWLSWGPRHADITEFRRLLAPAFANMILPLAQALNIQGMLIVAGATLGPVAVVVLSTLRTLTRLTLQLVLSVSQAAEPELASAWGKQNIDVMRTLFVHVLRAGVWLALVSTALLVLFGDEIVELWTRSQVSPDGELFAWLLASSFSTALWYGALTALKAANRHIRASIVIASSAALAVGLAALVLPQSEELSTIGKIIVAMDLVVVAYTIGAARHALHLGYTADLVRAVNPIPLLDQMLRVLNRSERRVDASQT